MKFNEGYQFGAYILLRSLFRLPKNLLFDYMPIYTNEM